MRGGKGADEFPGLADNDRRVTDPRETSTRSCE